MTDVLPADVRVAVVGAGAVGSRVIRQLRPEVADLVAHDRSPEVTDQGSARSVGLDDVLEAQVVVVATPAPQAPLVSQLLGAGCSVVSTSDATLDVEDLLDLHHQAVVAGARLVVGACMAPGLSGLLARHLANGIDVADEVHLAMHGTGGPACAHQHHRALGGRASAWQDGGWIHRPAGSGRELCWFPEPIGPRDCYRAEVADPMLLHRAMPELQRISARMAATRRDRLTARLPMLSPPHREGGIGALRVEVRGRRDEQRVTSIAGASERAAVVAAAVAATMGMYLVGTIGDDEPDPGVVVCGSADLPTTSLLASVARRGIRLHEFVGAEELTDW